MIKLTNSKEIDNNISADVFNNMVNNSLDKTKKVKKNFKFKKALTNMTISALIGMIMLSSVKANTDISKINFMSEKAKTSISMDVLEFEKINIPYFQEYESNEFDFISDSDNVYVHNISNEITNGIKNKLTKREYAFLCEALKWKKIRDIINEDGTFNINSIDLSKEVISYLVPFDNRKLNFDEIEIIKQKIRKTKFYKDENFYSNKILDATIAEIVTSDSGFDAMVLEKNGDYFITNTCCGEEKEDIIMIAYDLVNRLVGDKDFYGTIAPMLFGEGGPYEFPKDYNIKYEDIIDARKYYEGQVMDSYKLISKYLIEGKNIKLGGYSLGAGTMLESYIGLSKNNPEICKNLKITLYNPYLGFIEGQNTKKEIEEFFKKYKNNIKIYCAEGDIVSQFNNEINLFNDSVIYLKGNKNIDYHLKDLNVINLIITEESRHSIYGVEYSSFDEKGNIKENGKQITLNEIANGTVKSNDIELLLEDAFSNNLRDIRNSIKDLDLGENEYMKKHIIKLYDVLIEYFENNIGNFSYDSLIDTITPSFAAIMHESVNKRLGWFTFISNNMNQRSSEENINIYIKEYFLTEDGKDTIETILRSLILEKTENIPNYLVNLGTNIYLKSDKTGINEAMYNIANFIIEKIETIDKKIKKTPSQMNLLKGLTNSSRVVKDKNEKINLLEENDLYNSKIK